MVRGRLHALAISNFLRQHDLVQVQWVFLSSVSGAPQRDTEHLERVHHPRKSAPLLRRSSALRASWSSSVGGRWTTSYCATSTQAAGIWWPPTAAPTTSRPRG